MNWGSALYQRQCVRVLHFWECTRRALLWCSVGKTPFGHWGAIWGATGPCHQPDIPSHPMHELDTHQQCEEGKAVCKHHIKQPPNGLMTELHFSAINSIKTLRKSKYNEKNIILKWALGFFMLCSAEHYVVELWMLKLELKRKMPDRWWAGEDKFITKMGSSHKLAMMDILI